MTVDDLIAFEHEVAEAFKARKVRGPIHLSGGNERQLIQIFQGIDRADWIFSNYRSHYHCLLHGVPRDLVMREILAGRSMTLCFPEYRFTSSAIVGGTLPIAVGVAAALKRSGSPRKVWVFVGDMAATAGAFHEATQYVAGHELPCRFVIEDNSLSCDTPTAYCWGESLRHPSDIVARYKYGRVYPHVGVNEWVSF